MFLETFLAFFLIFQLRRTLRTFSPDPIWDKRFTIAMYAIGGLALFEIVFPIEYVTKWIWHLVLILIIIITFQKPAFVSVRLTMYAFLPLVIISLLGDILAASKNDFLRDIENYMDYAYPVAITWMIALLIRSRKQNKALAQERKKREEEEEQYRIMSERKAELEAVVMERTEELVKQKEELQHALSDLKSTQAQLIHREKMASLGELTAGIAHEIQNPLNFVNNFSEISVELSDELHQEINNLSISEAEKNTLFSFIKDLKANQQKINHHGRRADAIVKGMLLHSRKSTGEKELTDINLLADEYMQLSYHGLRAKDKSFSATMQTHFDESLEKINIVPQDMGRVFLNLFTNAFYSVSEKKKLEVGGFEPIVSVSTKNVSLQPPGWDGGRGVGIRIRDNGMGMSKEILDKIFQPFFSTKPTGQGTGLGLSISYDIVTKIHGGQMQVKTKETEFAEFIILLPA
jgi:signal transduction histidine kinase